MEANRISVEEVKKRMDRGEPLLFLDTRSSESWEKSTTQIPGSMRVPADEVGERLNDIPRGRAIVAYCT